MEKISRVKKYQNLRESLQNDAETKIETPDLSEFANRLNKIDANQFEKIEIEDVNHDPIHARRNRYLTESGDIQEDLGKTTQFSFNNEYLDEYISEVKQYNKNKGLLKNEDTSLNILENMKQDKVNYSDFMMEKENVQSDVKMQDISADVQSLVSQSFNEFTRFEEEEIIDEIVEEEVKPRNVKKIKADDAASLRKKLQDYDYEDEDEDDEDEDENRGSNKILNVILIVLILALFILLGVVLYWILLSNGTI